MVDPISLTVGLGWSALVIYKLRFSQHAQMRAILRTQVVNGEQAQRVPAGEVRREGGERAESTPPVGKHRKRPEQRKRRFGRGECRSAAAALLVIHAVSAVLVVSFALGSSELNEQLAVLASLVAHVALNMYIFPREERSDGDDDRLRSGSATLAERDLRMIRLNGRYIKDRDASESMDPLCDLMVITGIKRYALRFIVGSDVEFSSGVFSFAAFSVVRWFKIKESYALDGTPRQHRRRDLRGGGMEGAAIIDDDGSVTVVNRFGGYREGTLTEVFSWPSVDVMEVSSVLENDFGKASFLQVFRRE